MYIEIKNRVAVSMKDRKIYMILINSRVINIISTSHSKFYTIINFCE